jgi:hypothetical protein
MADDIVTELRIVAHQSGTLVVSKGTTPSTDLVSERE